MPTGYTAAIGEGDGITFEEFAWSCARGMGALIMMRDHPRDAEVPYRFEVDSYYAKLIKEHEDKIKQLKSMNREQIVLALTAEITSVTDSNAEYRQEKEKLETRYKAMLGRVKAWEPPTEDHQGMKKFMTEQLEESIRFDCGSVYQQAIPSSNPDQWLNAKLAEATADLAYAQKHYSEEFDRTEARNAWIAALRSSVPQPTAKVVKDE